MSDLFGSSFVVQAGSQRPETTSTETVTERKCHENKKGLLTEENLLAVFYLKRFPDFTLMSNSYFSAYFLPSLPKVLVFYLRLVKKKYWFE